MLPRLYLEASDRSAEPSASTAPRPRRAREPRQTELARKRRLARIVRDLAREAGISAPSIAERGALEQAATLAMRAADLRTAIVRGEPVDGGELIRLSGEARRVLAGLRKRADAKPHVPLRDRLAAEAAGKGA